MVNQGYKSFSGTAAENYQRYFVPAVAAPVAEDLLETASLRPGERVLDVACGTGVVTRLAAKHVGPAGRVAGLDVNPGMLAVARSESPAGDSIDWYEASAESMPLRDEAFDVVLCQMGLQFVPDKPAALREMQRVLTSEGRIYVTLPGPRPPIFKIMAEALARHLGPKAASFVDLVFSMHDAARLTELLRSAGFREVGVQAKPKELRLPPPKDFLWQYIHSTPLAAALAQADSQKLDALERDVCNGWQAFVTNGALAGQVSVTTGRAMK
jgi:ubiquinone/menaquinone biosynthesis C-methylase UbiE